VLRKTYPTRFSNALPLILAKLKDICRLAQDEAKMAIAYLERNYSEAIERGESILRSFPYAVFANYTLARIAYEKRQFLLALNYYNKLLEICPRSDRAILDTARTLFMLRRREEAIRLVRQASPSLRRRLYEVFLPIGNPLSVLALFFGISALSILVKFNSVVLIGIVITFILGALFSLRIDPLIFGLLLYIDMLILVTWGLTFFIWGG
jgi:tetratricopeptide (TPR) repeat protein